MKLLLTKLQDGNFRLGITTPKPQVHWATGLPYADTCVDAQKEIEIADAYETQQGTIEIDGYLNKMDHPTIKAAIRSLK